MAWGCRVARTTSLTSAPAIVFAPHPDDESIACGGMIALKRAAGIPVTIIFTTDGSASHGSSPISPNAIAALRHQEAIRAASLLGVDAADLIFLNHPDLRLRELLAGPARNSIIDQVAQMLRDRPSTEVYVPHRHDGHPDHEATFEIVTTAAHRCGRPLTILQYPVWIHFNTPLFARTRARIFTRGIKLNVQSVLDQKRRAIAAHTSQIPQLPPGFLTPFLSRFEVFYRTP